MESKNKGEKPDTTPKKETTAPSKEGQWQNFDKAKEKLFGPKKGNGSNRA